MIKSLTSLIFFVFFCSLLAATLNTNNAINNASAAEHNIAASYYLATQGSHL